MQRRRTKGFSLIELLVVISIIGTLSGIVLASLNSARDKGVEVAIRSNLRNMIPQAELAHSSVTPNSYSTACASISGIISGLSTSLNATSTCWTYDNTRWGAAARLNTSTFKAWGVDSSGVVTWDTKGVNSSGVPISSDTVMNWMVADAACAAAGGRLPTFEQLKSLRNTYGSVPPGFQADSYWSGTTNTSNSNQVYSVYMPNGNLDSNDKSTGRYVRCVH